MGNESDQPKQQKVSHGVSSCNLNLKTEDLLQSVELKICLSFKKLVSKILSIKHIVCSPVST